MVSKPLNASLSVVLMALSVALISLSFQLKKVFSEKIENSTAGIDMVVGAKGSPLQLILASVLHVDNPTGNINYAEAQKLSRNPLVKQTIPLSYGDNYKGYRIIGTTEAYQELYNATLASGSNFTKSHQVVVGANVAKNLSLQLEDELISSHGLVDNDVNAHHDHALKVVGIFKPTNTVLDNVIVTSIETIWHVHEHEGEENHEEEEEKEITSLLVQFRNPMAMVQLPRMINQQTNMQAALTNYELERLFNFTGIGVQVITLIAIAILIISIFSIFISLYRIVKERRYELALMRVYGATATQLVLVVLIEGLLLGVIGYVVGIILSKLGMFFFGNYIGAEFKYSIQQSLFIKEEIYLLGGMVLLLIIATLAATLPVFKLNVSKILTDEE